MPVSAEQKSALKKQFEFYFSDVNLSKDVFLKSKMAEHPEGFVPLSTFLLFNRVKAATQSVDDLIDALEGCDGLIIDPSAKLIRRAAPLPDSIQVDEQTVYAKPIPPSASLEELQSFFGQYGTVRAVWRRYFGGSSGDHKNIKPSVFVVFGSRGEAEAFIASGASYAGVPLQVHWKLEYLQAKAKEIAEKNKGKKPLGKAAGAAPQRERSQMPRNSSYRVDGCGTFEKFSAVKGLWPANEQKGIRYVSNPDKSTALIIFQDEAVATEMVDNVKKRGTTINGLVPTITKLTGSDEEQLIAEVEREIAGREEQRNMSPGRGRGRGRGRGGKRPRQG
jgi:lupus La protein